MHGLQASYALDNHQHAIAAWDVSMLPESSKQPTRACLTIELVSKGGPQSLQRVRAATIILALEGDTLMCNVTFVCVPPISNDASLASMLWEHCARVCVANKVPYVGCAPDQGDRLLVSHWRLQPCPDGLLRLAVPKPTEPLSPTVPLLVLLGDVRILPATDDVRRDWCQLVLRSCSHNLGGSEMMTVTWNAALRLVAYDERTTPRRMVGMVCMTNDGWIPYVSAIGAEGLGLGSFLLFVALEWFRLTKGHTAGLSPSDIVVKSWYKRWGFSLTHPAHPSVPMSDQIMRRTIDPLTPLLPRSLFHYVPDVVVPRHLREPYLCVLCLGFLTDAPATAESSCELATAPTRSAPLRTFKTPELLRKHLESHHFCGEINDSHVSACAVMGTAFGWPTCSVCRCGFDVYECGACNRCWHTNTRKRKGPSSSGVDPSFPPFSSS